MATGVHTPTREELEELERKARALPLLQSVGWEWDFPNGRVTLTQKVSELAIYPQEITLTFETLTLAYYLLLKTSLEMSGVMQQMGPISAAHSPSGGPSDSPRSQPNGPRLL